MIIEGIIMIKLGLNGDVCFSCDEAVYLMACPLDERAPRRHWIAERRRLKESWHLSQLRVVLYGLSHFSASMEASLL